MPKTAHPFFFFPNLRPSLHPFPLLLFFSLYSFSSFSSHSSSFYLSLLSTFTLLSTSLSSHPHFTSFFLFTVLLIFFFLLSIFAFYLHPVIFLLLALSPSVHLPFPFSPFFSYSSSFSLSIVPSLPPPFFLILTSFYLSLILSLLLLFLPLLLLMLFPSSYLHTLLMLCSPYPFLSSGPTYIPHSLLPHRPSHNLSPSSDLSLLPPTSLSKHPSSPSFPLRPCSPLFLPSLFPLLLSPALPLLKYVLTFSRVLNNMLIGFPLVFLAINTYG